MSMGGNKGGVTMADIGLLDWINDTLPSNKYRGLDGEANDFPFHDTVLLAQSGHDAFFRLTRDIGWGVRWYAMHRVSDKFVFTVGHGCWAARREVPAELVPDLLGEFFTRNEVTEAGRALLK
jgi:hypothetical protein